MTPSVACVVPGSCRRMLNPDLVLKPVGAYFRRWAPGDGQCKTQPST